jgi:hypothetical protein
MRTVRLCVYAVSARPTAAMAAPAVIRGRRPRVSASRPANGRASSAVTAKAPNATPAAAAEAPNGPVTAIGSV